jgi:hypothetical protein
MKRCTIQLLAPALCIIASFACNRANTPADEDLPIGIIEVVDVQPIPVAKGKYPHKEPIKSNDTVWVAFDVFSLGFPGLEFFVKPSGKESDTVTIALDIVADLDDQIVVYRDSSNESYDSIRLFESYRTILSISNEGPHLDLYEWKGHESGWIPLVSNGQETFKTKNLSKEESSQFPEFTREELTAAADRYSGGRWGDLVRNPIFGEWTESFWIGVGLRRIKVELFKEGGKKTRILVVYIPMGC